MLPSLLLLALLPFLQQPGDSTTDRTLPPPGTSTAATVQGRGAQVYRCSLGNGKMGWELVGPDAVLVRASDGVQVGTHSAGPSWHWTDGSSITGNVIASAPASQGGNLPTLLLEAFPSGNTRGFLSNVLWVRRSGVEGGVAPADGCDAGHMNTTVRVPYTATYTFYNGAVSATSPPS